MRELPSLLNNMLSHSNDDHNGTFLIAATRWQVLKEVRLDLTCTGAAILCQHTHAGAQGTLRLKFYQTRSNAIILHETLPANCIPKVVRMETGEVIYEQVYISPRPPPKISLRHDGKRELARGREAMEIKIPGVRKLRERSEQGNLLSAATKRPHLTIIMNNLLKALSQHATQSVMITKLGLLKSGKLTLRCASDRGNPLSPLGERHASLN